MPNFDYDTLEDQAICHSQADRPQNTARFLRRRKRGLRRPQNGFAQRQAGSEPHQNGFALPLSLKGHPLDPALKHYYVEVELDGGTVPKRMPSVTRPTEEEIRAYFRGLGYKVGLPVRLLTH